MKFTKTSITVTATLGFIVAASSSAFACEWDMQQVHASVPSPAVEEQVEATASPINPVVLARIEALAETEASQ